MRTEINSPSRPKKTRPRPTQTQIEIYRFVPGGGVELSNKNGRSLVYGCLCLALRYSANL